MTRFNPFTEITDKEVNDCINELENYFDFNINSIVKEKYDMVDSNTTIELFCLSNAIKNCAKIDKNWVNKHIKIIEKNDLNNAYGSLWEIIFAGMLIESGINVTLEKDFNPGIDVSANIRGEIVHFSLKRYDKSTHYARLGLHFDNLRKLLCTFKNKITTVLIYFKKYPSSENIIKDIEKYISDQKRNPQELIKCSNDDYQIIINKNKKQFDSKVKLCEDVPSFNMMLISELHKNEKQNLYDKIDSAIDNLNRFKKVGENIICIHISSAAPIDALSKYVEQYFKSHTDCMVNGLIFYQPNLSINNESNHIQHVIKYIVNPNHNSEKKLKGPIPIFKVTTGEILTDSKPNVLNICSTQSLSLNEKYYFQFGKLYEDFVPDNNGKMEAKSFKLGPNLTVIPVIKNGDQIFAIEAKEFPKKDELQLI